MHQFHILIDLSFIQNLNNFLSYLQIVHAV
jgi:hypothetical protein